MRDAIDISFTRRRRSSIAGFARDGAVFPPHRRRHHEGGNMRYAFQRRDMLHAAAYGQRLLAFLSSPPRHAIHAAAVDHLFASTAICLYR